MIFGYNNYSLRYSPFLLEIIRKNLIYKFFFKLEALAIHRSHFLKWFIEDTQTSPWNPSNKPFIIKGIKAIT